MTSFPVPATAAQATDNGLPAFVWLFTGAMCASMFSGHSDALKMPVGPDRLLLAAAVLLLLLDHVEWERVRLRLGPVHLCMASLVLVAALSASASGTLRDMATTYALLDRLLIPFVMFTLAPVVYRTAERRALLLKSLVVAGLYLALCAVGERFAPGLVWPRYIVDPSVGGQFGRARGPFATSVPNGVVLAICGFACVLAASQLSSRWRLLATTTAPLCGFGVLLGLTRSVWLGSIAGVVLALVSSPAGRRRLPVVAVALAAAVALALAVVPGLQDDAGARTQNQRSVDDRLNTNRAAVKIVMERPLTGVGFNRFPAVSADWVRQADDYPITNINIEVHNVLLSRSAELGLVGGALWLLSVLGSIGAAAVPGRRDAAARPDAAAWRMLLIGSAAVWLTCAMLTPAGQPMPNQLVLVLAGVALGGRLLREVAAPETSPAGLRVSSS